MNRSAYASNTYVKPPRQRFNYWMSEVNRRVVILNVYKGSESCWGSSCGCDDYGRKKATFKVEDKNSGNPVWYWCGYDYDDEKRV